MQKEKAEKTEFEKSLYKNIGTRIKQYRKERKETQKEFVAEFMLSDVSLLSKIENGKIDDRQNPHLLPKSFIENTQNLHNENSRNISLKEMIWGTESEQEQLVQIFLLYTLMNGSKDSEGNLLNPFFYTNDYEELFLWAKRQKPISQDLLSYLCTACAIIEKESPIKPDQKYILPAKTPELSSDKDTPTAESISINELMSSVREYFADSFGFFFQKESYDIYELLNEKNEFSKERERISNLLLKSILNEPIFAQSFLRRLSNFIWNMPQLRPDKPEQIKYDINKFIMNKGNYGEIVLDYKEGDYYLFINAFQKFWEKKKSMYMSYFNKVLFNEELYLKNGLKFLNVEYIRNQLCSSEFITLNEQSGYLDMYYEEEAIISTYYQQLTLQELFLRNQIDIGKENNSAFYSYINSMHMKTTEYINNQILNSNISE